MTVSLVIAGVHVNFNFWFFFGVENMQMNEMSVWDMIGMY